MKIGSQPVKTPAPVCGILSLAVPFVAAGVGCLAISLVPVGDSGWGMLAWFFAFGLVAVSAGAGMLLAVIGTVRHERFGVVRWMALVLNAILLSCLLAKWFS